MFKSDICEALGIQYPIIQGAMAWIADSILASSVSNAGGLGIIAAGNNSPENVRLEIRKAKELTDKPFGVNIMLLSDNADEVAKIVCEEGVKVVTTGAGNPGIPVIAAGGIGDSRGMLAALALGANGFQVGTRFLAANECTIHENYKKKVVESKDIDSVVTGRSTGHPVRVLRNRLSREYLRLEKLGTSAEELEQLGVGGLKKAVIDGDVDNGSIMAGQIAALIKKEESCEEIIKDFVEGTETLLKSMINKF